MTEYSEVSEKELIKIYSRAYAQEHSDMPFGAEQRRKEAGDELIRRGITELRFAAFKDPFKVFGSETDAPKNTRNFGPTVGKGW